MKSKAALKTLLCLLTGTMLCVSLTACKQKGPQESDASHGSGATDEDGNLISEEKNVTLYVQEAFCGSWYLAEEQYDASRADEIVLQLTTDGSSLVVDGAFNMDVLAEEPVVTERPDGGFYVTFVLKDTLKWSDGRTVTAEDYVLPLALFSQGDVCNRLAGYCDVMQGSCFDGWEEYHRSTWTEAVSVSTGHIEPFSGVHLMGEYSFACELTALGDTSPEEVLDLIPLPSHIWLPKNVSVLDDGEGVFLSSAARASYMADYLQGQNLNVSAGEYYIDSYDSTKGQVLLSKNPYYTGTSVMPDGVSYDNICLIDSSKQNGLQGADEEQALSQTLWQEYEKEELTHQPALCLVLPVNWETIGAYEALADIIDYEALGACYEKAGWHITVSDEPDEESSEDNLEAPGEQPGTPITPEEIALVLAEEGWNLNSAKEPYEGTDGVRYREAEDGTLVPCSVTICLPYEAKDAAAKLLSGYTTEELLTTIGMRVEVVCVDAGTWQLLWDDSHIGVGVREEFVESLKDNPLTEWLSVNCCQR